MVDGCSAARKSSASCSREEGIIVWVGLKTKKTVGEGVFRERGATEGTSEGDKVEGTWCRGGE
jgi:hypothetical protein